MAHSHTKPGAEGLPSPTAGAKERNMRIVRLTSLVIVAATAMMAFVGTGSASASHAYTFCKQPEWLCSSGNLFTLRGRPEWRATTPRLLGMLEEQCEKGEAEGSETAEELKDEGGMESTIESLSFAGNCKPCTTVTTSTPYKSIATMASEGEEENWTFALSGFSVQLSGCPLGVKCKFGATEVKAKIESGEEGGVFDTKGAELKLEEGSKFTCGAVAKWSSKWRIVYVLHTGAEDPAWWALRSL